MEPNPIADAYARYVAWIESKGIPALPALLVLILVLLAGLGFAATKLFHTQSIGELSVSVLSASGQVVPDARVQLYDERGNFLQEQKSDGSGRVHFEGILVDKAVLKVLKPGFELASTVVRSQKAVSVSLSPESVVSAGVVRTTLTVTDLQSQSPIADAQLSYSIERSSQSVSLSTDAQGRATVTVPEGKTVNMLVRHPNYKEKALSFKSKSGQTIDVKLEKRSGAPVPVPIGTAHLEYGDLTVSVLTPSGSPASEGTVTLWDASTDSQLATKSVSGGTAVFSDLLQGSQVYLSAAVPGYLPYIATDRMTVKKSTRAQIHLRSQATSNQFAVHTLDDSGMPVTAQVSLYSSDNRLLLSKSGSGEVQFSSEEISSLTAAGSVDSYYVTASSEGLLPAISSIFSAPFSNDVSLYLSVPTSQNSAHLTVQTQDAQRASAPNLAVTVISDGRILAQKSSGASASAEFILPNNAVYTLVETQGESKGFGRIELSSDQTYALFLSGPIVFLRVHASDALSQESVSAQYSLVLSGSEFDQCSGSSCYLRLPQFSNGKLVVNADGYPEYSAQVSALAEEEKEVAIDLVALEKIEGVMVKWLGVYDALDAPVKQLQAGQSYTAKLLLASKDATSTGISLRIGSAPKSTDDVASLSGLQSLTAPSSQKGYSEIGSGNVCPAQASGAPYKTLEAIYPGSLVQEVRFQFSLKENLAGKTSIPFSYRAYAVQAMGYVRSPADDALGSLESSLTKAGCFAKTTDISLPVSQEKEFKCQSAGCLTVSLEQDGFVAGEGFQARSLSGCDAGSDSSSDSCEQGALKFQFDFEPSPIYRNGEFDFQITQKNGISSFKSYQLNGVVAPVPTASSLRSTFQKTAYAQGKLSTWPLQEGSETYTVEIWPKGKEELKVSQSVSFTVLASCGQGKRVCPDGSCQYVCLSIPTPTPVIVTPIPCASGLQACLDGVCRASCGYIGTPIPTPSTPPIPCSDDSTCAPQSCDLETGTCFTENGGPTPTPSDTPSVTCGEIGGSCQGACGDFEQCDATAQTAICSSGICCAGTCSVPKSCQSNAECPSNECDLGAGTCMPTRSQSNAACEVEVAQTALNSGQSTAVQINYRQLASVPYSISVLCGNGQTVRATNCLSTTGFCTALCPYAAAGSYSLTASASGTVCRPSVVSVSDAPDNSQCQVASDCGTDGFTGTPFCQNGNVYGSYQVRSCQNAGQSDSRCASTSAPRLVQTCTNGCQNGACSAPDVGPEPTPEAGIGIDIVNGKLVARTGSIELHPDPIFPGDALRLGLTPKCRSPLFSVRSPNAACYSVEEQYLIFRGAPFSSSCPLGLEGGSLAADASSTLLVSCPGDASNTLELTVKTVPDNSVSPTYILPAALEGSSSKLFHVVSETQGLRRFKLNAVQNVEFSGAGVQSFAWSGDGVLELFEGEQKAASVFYTPVTTYFPQISDQGGRVESCSDSNCCANGWCTTSAAASQFNAFKQAAQRTAEKTAFRGSLNDRLPYSKVTDAPFVYSAVVRLVQGARLPAQVRTLDGPSAYGCESDAPAVYELSASTRDGKSWRYEARISRLYRYQYIAPKGGQTASTQCPSSSQTPASPSSDSQAFSQQSSGGYLALCNFLTGEGPCIDATDDSTIASAEQVDKKSSLFPILVPSSFWQIPLKKAACETVALSETTAYAAEIAICQSIYDTELGACTGTLLAYAYCASLAYTHKVECFTAATTKTTTSTESRSTAITAGGSDIDLPGIFPLLRKTHLACTCEVFPAIPDPGVASAGGVVTCQEACTPKRSYVVSAMCHNRLFAIAHMGVSPTCSLDAKALGLAVVELGAAYKYPQYQSYATLLGTLVSNSWGTTDTETPLLLKGLEKITTISLAKQPALRYAIENALESLFYTKLCEQLGG